MRGGQGLRQGGEGGQGLHASGDGVEEHDRGGGNYKRAPVGEKGKSERSISGGEGLPGVVVQIDQGYGVPARVGGSKTAVVGDQKKLGVGRQGDRSRLGRHVHRSSYGIVRSGHNFDAVRREVSNVENAPRFIEGDIGCVAADGNDCPKAGCNAGRRAQQSGERGQDQAIVPAHKFRVLRRYD